MRRLFSILIGLAVLGLVVFWVVTMPQPRDMEPYAGLTGDKVHGRAGVLGLWLCLLSHGPQG